MGLFDDLLGKASELTSMGEDVAAQVTDAASQATEDITTQAQEHITNVTEQLPQDLTDGVGGLFGNNNQE